MTLNFSLGRGAISLPEAQGAGWKWWGYQIPCAQCGRAWSKGQAIPVMVASHPHRALVPKYKPLRALGTKQLAARATEEPSGVKPSAENQKGRLREAGQGTGPVPDWGGDRAVRATLPLPFMAGSGNGRSTLKKQ